nr:MAG TPA: hypothetical protein [Caudoviricetes sp.]
MSLMQQLTYLHPTSASFRQSAEDIREGRS